MTRAELTLIALVVAIAFACIYGLALIGEPQSVWLMQLLGLIK